MSNILLVISLDSHVSVVVTTWWTHGSRQNQCLYTRWRRLSRLNQWYYTVNTWVTPESVSVITRWTRGSCLNQCYSKVNAWVTSKLVPIHDVRMGHILNECLWPCKAFNTDSSTTICISQTPSKSENLKRAARWTENHRRAFKNTTTVFVYC